MSENETAKYKIIVCKSGNRYKFFCDASGIALCVTKPIIAETQEEELRLAWKNEGRYYFNRCAKCGRYVSNAMFNADVLRCVDCAPWEEKPKFCAQCGKKVQSSERYCTYCGRLLRYGQEEDGDDG